MVPIHEALLFAGLALLMVLSPGPNMVYVVSRSVSQGRRAGALSVLGVAAGFLVHAVAAAAGVTAVLLAVPLAYDLLKWAGAAYLLWLAGQALRPGSPTPFEPRSMPPDSAGKLVLMGFLTNALNPKIAVFYLSVFPQFVVPAHGSVFLQGLTLGLIQIAVSFSVNLSIALFAARLAAWFARNPVWLAVQRYLTAFVLGALAVRLAFEPRAHA